MAIKAQIPGTGYNTTTAVNIRDYFGQISQIDGSPLWSKITELGFRENLKNNEIFSKMFGQVIETSDSTFSISWSKLRTVTTYDDVNTTGMPLLESKALIQFWDEYPLPFADDTTVPVTFYNTVGYSENLFTKRIASMWGEWVARAEAENALAKLLSYEFFALEMYKVMSFASGRFKYTPTMSKSVLVPGDEDKINVELAGLQKLAISLATQITDRRLGLPIENQRIIMNAMVLPNMLQMQKQYSASDTAYGVMVAGRFVEWAGMTWTKSMLLNSKKMKKGLAFNALRDFDFSNIVSVVTYLNSVKTYTTAMTDMGTNGVIRPEISKSTVYYEKAWKTMSIMEFNYEEMNYLFINKLPTLAEMNKVRAWLVSFQPGLYKTTEGFAPLTQAQYDALVAASKDFTALVNRDGTIETIETITPLVIEDAKSNDDLLDEHKKRVVELEYKLNNLTDLLTNLLVNKTVPETTEVTKEVITVDKKGK